MSCIIFLLLTYNLSFLPLFIYRLLTSPPSSYQLAMRRKNTSTGINFQATEMYNDIARQLLQGTGVVLWDSTLPLSVIYANECMKTRRLTPITYDWKCHDVNHLGYIMLEQYADMVYNGICNRYLDLSDEYCNVNG